MTTIISVRNVYKHYVAVKREPQYVLQDIDLQISAGQFTAIVGPSGNGKSTLLNLMAGIDRPSKGEVVVNGAALHKLSENRLSVWRGGNMGIVFQFFQLLPSLSLLQNVVLPMDFLGKLPKRLRKERAETLLKEVGLVQEMHRLPSQVSGGQQQRAAIARAMANNPPLIVADEPTGNLDEATANDVFALFKGLAEQGTTLIMATHNPTLAEAADRKVTLIGGKVVADNLNPKPIG